jgi:A/G-specific adenine glycosylase
MPRKFLNAASRNSFRNRLLHWFDREKRNLPWRGESDPYRILVSEIMLQQTRVAVVKERYEKFLAQFPSIRRLAGATEESVLAAWSGLGYYRRARAFHAAAKEIYKRRSFPGRAAELIELPGIGRYTAAAVASIAFGEPVAVVDGNVRRVLQRLAGAELSGDECWQSATSLLDRRKPGDFNQAMMELGATLCLPGQPTCSRCPVGGFCATRGPGTAKARSPRKKALLNYLLACKPGAVLLQRRSPSVSLMPGMWELPLLTHRATQGKIPVLKLRHSITTTDYSILVFSARPTGRPGSWIPIKRIDRLPLTGLARKILQKSQIL